MIPATITDSDKIILETVDSYLEKVGAPLNSSPQEQIFIKQQARDYLYSEIVTRLPRVVTYILKSDLESNPIAQGLHYALSRHVMDPIFINMLMQFLGKENIGEQNSVCGAYLAKVMAKYLDTHTTKAPVTDKDKDKKKDSKDENNLTPDEAKENVAHIYKAVAALLGNIAGIVSVKCGNLTDEQALALAAALAMNNSTTIQEIIMSGLPVTADILNIIQDNSILLQSALLIDKDDLPGKPTTNQQAFMDSLVRWVYKNLNERPTHMTYHFMVATYKTSNANVEKKFINPRDCGNQYPNLKMVAEQIINNK